jgi:hypothetical protein
MLTGHEVFGEYLLRIQREVTSICHHCGEEEDTAQLTLKFCPAWAEARRVLQLDIGESLAPEAVIEAILRGPSEYNAVRSYCERVMLVKERAERNRERARDPSRAPRRRQRQRDLARHGNAAPPPPTPGASNNGTRHPAPGGCGPPLVAQPGSGCLPSTPPERR